MSDEAWVERLKLLSLGDIHELIEILSEYAKFMPGGVNANPQGVNMVMVHLMGVLRGDKA